MSFSRDIRIGGNKIYQELYNDLKATVFNQSNEIFFYCVCLAYKKGKTRTSPVENRKDLFYGYTCTENEVAVYNSLMIEDNDMNINSINDEKKVVKRMEEYADAGMKLFLESTLKNYLSSKSKEPRLDLSLAKELPKVALYNILEQSLWKIFFL